MLKVLTNEWQCPWSLLDIKEQILTLLQEKEVKFMHILREGNQLADYYSNLAIDKGNFEVNSFQQLDSKARRILNSDKMQCPYIRVTSRKERQGRFTKIKKVLSHIYNFRIQHVMLAIKGDHWFSILLVHLGVNFRDKYLWARSVIYFTLIYTCKKDMQLTKNMVDEQSKYKRIVLTWAYKQDLENLQQTTP